MPKQNGGTLTYRVSELEKKVDRICDKVDIIRTNHLPHINEDILKLREELKTQLIELRTTIKIWAAIQLGSILLALVIQQVFLN